VTVTGLSDNTGYRVMVCEYFNGFGETEIYQFEVAANNPVNFTTTKQVSISTPEKDKVSVYPIPFNEYLSIDLKFESSDFVAIIYSLDGRLQLRSELTGIKSRINTSKLTSGAYILQISDGETSYNCKIVK
jgi:hypothetical protein